jgi:hypothetical protein
MRRDRVVDLRSPREDGVVSTGTAGARRAKARDGLTRIATTEVFAVAGGHEARDSSNGRFRPADADHGSGLFALIQTGEYHKSP